MKMRDPITGRVHVWSPGCRVGGCTPVEVKEGLRESIARILDAEETSTLPSDAQARKGVPMARGLLDYFPAALAAVAELSRIGNEQHNPGEEMHWARAKSDDHADCVIRHLMDRGKIDSDGVRHSVKAAWRALANAQIELEQAGAPKARGAK
jgi:hypothetical protein